MKPHENTHTGSSGVLESRLAEQRLQESEARFKAISETARDWIFCKDKDLRYTYVNPAMCGDLGLPDSEILGRTAVEVFQDESSWVLRQDALVLTGATVDSEIALPVRGQRRLLHVVKVPLHDESGAAIGLCGIVRDITEIKKKHQTAVRESAFRQAVIQNVCQALVVANLVEDYPYLRFTVWNKQAEEITGYTMEEVNRLGWSECMFRDPVLKEKSAARVLRLFQGEPMVNEEWEVTSKDGTNKLLEFSCSIMEGAPGEIHVLGLARDITEKKRLQEEMARMDRMHSVGMLASGIAHNFNNLLMGIQGNTSLMLLSQDPHHEHYGKLKNIEALIQDASSLTRQILGYAKGGKYVVRTMEVNAIVEKTASMFARTRKEVNVHLDLGEPCLIDADQAQIEQVLINLYVNAWQAMPHGGDIFIKTSRIVQKEPDSGPGAYVRISVQDTGTGIDGSILSKIFEPFFTTKKKSRGIGLGLSSADGIVKNHGGHITVETKAGAGSTFHVFLPASAKKPKKAREARPGIAYGNETILIVDDEKLVLNACEELLKALGYTVLTARTKAEALDLYARRHKDIDLVILDMVMPGAQGNQVFEELKKINPGVVVLFSSGYPLEDEAARMVRQGGAGFIQKPFSLGKISQTIRNLL